MTPFNLRSLLLAAIFLSNCISWTASRHHLKHTVSGHRSRHRRQGTGLFLSASYVLPGGEGNGWGEWGEVSPCSRTCGGGVASQKRICLQIGPDGQPLCSGGDTKYFSCQTQDCPAGSKDFRAQQCSEYDDKPFHSDFRYKWVPYKRAQAPCELNCMPHLERFYYRHKEKVIDGTRCNDDSFDVCVNGTCQPVGCDMMLGSNAKEDKCRECRGSGANCQTTAGVLDAVDLRNGYNDMLLIPEGATTIVIEERGPSSNYLALRAKNGTYYLNGNYNIDFPRRLPIAGAMWTYDRDQRGSLSPDKLRCLGPTNEPIYLSLLIQDENVGVEYEYSLPTDLAPPRNKQYNWVHEEFTPCSATCGGGFQTRNVTCRSREELEEVDEGLCDEGMRPATNQSCNTQACDPRWVPRPWGACSKRCGKGGTRRREVNCEKIITNGYSSIVGRNECYDMLGPEPKLFEECNENATCPTWFTGPWKPCDRLCDEGTQTRQVVCYQRNGKRIEVLDETECEDERPADKQACLLELCDGVDWVVSDWLGCDSCLSENQTRIAVCATKYNKVVNDSLCAYHAYPTTVKACTKLPPCEVQWYATQWSKCSVECGKGTQSRKVFCGMYDGKTVVNVADELCANKTKYNTTKPCEIPKEECPSLWFAGPWSACTETCGGGKQSRTVMCLRGEQPATDCDGERLLTSEQSCNEGPCDADELLSVTGDLTAVTDADGYEDCLDEYDEETFDEVGLDLDTMSTDGMFSDASWSEGSGFGSTGSTLSFAELESHFSDTESTMSSDELLTVSTDSGTGSTETLFTDSEETGSTPEFDSTTSSLIDTDETTESGATNESETTVSGLISESDSSITTESGPTETTESGPTSESESTDTTESGPTSESGSTETTESGPTSESDSTDATETTESGSTATDETGPTTDLGSTGTDETTESGPTTESGSTATDVTESTETDITESTSESGSTETTESGPTETTETGPTETTDFGSTTVSGSSETDDTESTTEYGSTETTETGFTTESGSTETTDAGSTTELGSTETTDAGSTTESGPTETTDAGSTTESGPTETTDAGSTTESGPTETTDAGSTTESGSTETTDAGSTTESGPTETTDAGSTTESGPTETTDEGSTVSGSTEASESGSTEVTETGFTTESGSTETTDGLSTTESGLTESSTLDGFSTSPAIEWTTQKKRVCRPRSSCAFTKFGCCPDNKTVAHGPFDGSCLKPRTCKEALFGCCPDGLSPAQGPKNKGCPVSLCNETLFGCCASDNKTAAQGNDQEGCPPPPPPCKSSKFGCCKDEKTEASGPGKAGCPETKTTIPQTEPTSTVTPAYEGCEKSEFGCCFDNTTKAAGPEQQGCPCGATEFGCCLDGVSQAEGPEYEGCVKSCNSSAYGCCSDGETPAHGPNQEGCCLKSPYGCCPDNYNPARGPNLEDCGCQYSPYGCCPDNVTSATGYNNKGCGCSYSPHGCCPDGHTEASGPQLNGCACHTYQFGCCPDGVTIAPGPDSQGCQCILSPYKCCGDGVTHATGPNQQGCDCSTSKYGCCPDGQTAANGTKFQGCADIPENRQAACGLKYERGQCKNYTVQWYYDSEYGGCSRFWYGGCEGNGNRFATKEECDDICIHPSPKDACKLPSSKGACFSFNVRWYYDSQRESCANFVYGSCLGNDNNFETRELCQKQCEPEKFKDQCDLSIEQGTCRGNFPRWGFDKESRQCVQFTWGGCEGNSNRFLTEAACELKCNPPGQPKPECSQRKDAGNCSDTEALWAFSQDDNRCLPFYYSGCGGNDNKFSSLEACEESCPSSYVPNNCTLPYETGNCANYREKWYFDTKDQRCRPFYYGGCGGNANSFVTESECQSVCQPEPTTTTVRPTAPPAAPPSTPAQQHARPQTADRQEFCFLELDSGPCQNMSTAWGYDYKQGRCVTFQYGGCGGNRNNFPDQDFCAYYCKATQDICQLPMQQGPCDDSQMKWFYDKETDSCSRFAYGGCEGNDNRFDSRESCESRCKTGPQTTLATTVAEPGSDIPSSCVVPSSLEPCSAQLAGEVWYLDVDADRQACTPHDNLAEGTSCRKTGVHRSQEACERTCGAFRGISNICSYPLDAGSCTEYVPKYHYNASSGRCEEFAYGGCLGGPNRFSTELECTNTCYPAASQDLCKLEPEQGNCNGRYELWYYDHSRDYCYQFLYGGCGGNDNKFETREACDRQCRKRPSDVMTTTTLAPATAPPPLELEPECVTPSSLESCYDNYTVFYYESVSRTCRTAPIGNCRYRNSYGSEEECERRCGAFRDLDACRAPLDPGPCRSMIPKYHFDATSGACKEFTYGGCNGGPNRFSSREECEELCASAGPAAACLQPVETGAPCAAPPSRRWQYSEARADCLVFAYQGCAGNDNNFLSYQECADLCNVPSDRDDSTQCALYDDECTQLETSCRTLTVKVAAEGCRQCLCEDCAEPRQACDALTCRHGVNTTVGDDGCERCTCMVDPCAEAGCTPEERCEASAYRDPATGSVRYTAHCIPVSDPDNNVQADCTAFEEQCRNARETCSFGLHREISSEGCEQCSCLPHPCDSLPCDAGQRCVLTPYRDPVSQESRQGAECRTVVKEGSCPSEGGVSSTERECRTECDDDADCRGSGKCCVAGCSRRCLAPGPPTTLPPPTTSQPPTQHITTYSPEGPQAPRASVETAPEVAAAEGGKATLRCIFHGNPPPKITWRFGEITIESDQDRYRVLSDGALEIVSLFRNDSGVYICIGENDLGRATQQVRLEVADPREAPVEIAGEANAGVVGELGYPLQVRCRAYGYPTPTVYWYRGIGGPMVPFSNAYYEARGQLLMIRRLSLDTLGEYACYAYNGKGRPATWVVVVRAFQPDDNAIPGPYLVERAREVPVTPPRHYTAAPVTTVTPAPTAPPQLPDIVIPPYIVEVETQLLPGATSLAAGAELRLPCEVNGNPEPRVTWTKDGAQLQPTDRIWITGQTLTIQRTEVSDSGEYGCHAVNPYSQHSSYVQITVQERVIPSQCTDSDYFANCALIVQGKFCRHKYYSKFCCKSCVESGQLDPSDVSMQADQPYRRK